MQLHTVMGNLQSKNIRVDGMRTSMRLEPPLWDALKDIARWEKTTIDDLVAKALLDSVLNQSNTSAVRAYIVKYFRTLVAENTVLVIMDKRMRD